MRERAGRPAGERRMEDISDVLRSWPYVPGMVRARVIRGEDGRDKVQLRVDMGVVQMDLDGRPDGAEPEGLATYLDHLRKMSGAYVLNDADKKEMDREIMQFYQRRVCMFAMKDYKRAARDAAHNLRAMDFVRGHSDDAEFVARHERWRTFVLADQARALAMDALTRKDRKGAASVLEEGISAVEGYLREEGRAEELSECEELNFLKQWHQKLTGTAERTLEDELAEAVRLEDYERAARIRDEIRRRAEHG